MAEKNSADVGLIGLAVMGQNLALNMADHGFEMAVFNRTIQGDERLCRRPILIRPADLSDAKAFRISWPQLKSRARS